MATDVLDAMRDKLFSHIEPEASPRIVWHGGEPTAVPLSWYVSAYEKLRPVAPAKAVFAIQTNGLAISETWIDFFRSSGTKVGISIDGPERFHDRRRRTRAGTSTWCLVLRNLRWCQSVGLEPTVISVLERESLLAADEFYEFYRDNEIKNVSFSIDEATGANLTSSFNNDNCKQAMAKFLLKILSRAFREGYPLYIREIERIARILVHGGELWNEQIEPWDIVSVAANGDVTTFSPEFMEVKSAAHNDFCFGNIVRDKYEELLRNAILERTAGEIRAGVDLCRRTCRYFGICGGGSPSNKISENKSLQSSETSFCRLSVQAAADALLEFLRENSAQARKP
jgi:uncharacterized protein